MAKRRKKALSRDELRNVLASKSLVKSKGRLPLTEKEKLHKNWTKQQCVEYLHEFCKREELRYVSHNYFKNYASISDSTWRPHFGTFEEYKRQAMVIMSRQQDIIAKRIAKHASVDHYREAQEERSKLIDLHGDYDRDEWVVGMAIADLHDVHVDPFVLRVWNDTISHMQPQIVTFTGDTLDFPDLGKWFNDVRIGDSVSSIMFIEQHIIGEARRRAPNARIDWITGNHEDRFLRYMQDHSKMLMPYLDEILGMSIADVFCVHKHRVNYIARADLSVFGRKKDIDAQLAKNHVEYDGIVSADHYPNRKSEGRPGFNGHNHKHLMWRTYNPDFGGVEWHQLGCGHRRYAPYTDAQHWDNGFLIFRYKPGDRKSVHFQYVQVKDDAFVNDILYTRSEEEKWWLYENMYSGNPLYPIIEKDGKVRAS